MSQPQIIASSHQAMRNEGQRDSTAGLTGGNSTSTSSGSGGSSNVVGVHYKVGKKIGEGSFGVIFEGTCISLVYAFAGLSCAQREVDNDKLSRLCRVVMCSVRFTDPSVSQAPIC
jgi:hypothetical protein